MNGDPLAFQIDLAAKVAAYLAEPQEDRIAPTYYEDGFNHVEW